MWLKLNEPDHDAVLYNAKFREKCTMAAWPQGYDPTQHIHN